MIRFLWVACTLMVASFSFSQTYMVNGKVKSQKLESIEGASIRLYTSDSLYIDGTVSDQKGNFRLKTDQPGNYWVKITAVGFQEQIVRISELTNSIELAAVFLYEKTIDMKELIVDGPEKDLSGERVIIYVSPKQKKFSANGIGLLKKLMLPGVQIDMSNKTVSSLFGNVALCINGKQAGKEEVMALPAKEVAYVEYDDSPDGVFSEYALLINYVTIKRESGGYVGLYVDQQQVKGEYLAAVKANYKKNEFSYIYSPDYAKISSESNISSEIYGEENAFERSTYTIDPNRIIKKNHINFLYYGYKTRNHTLDLDFMLNKNYTDRVYRGIQIFNHSEYEDKNINSSLKEDVMNASYQLVYTFLPNKRHRLNIKSTGSLIEEETNYGYDEASRLKGTSENFQTHLLNEQKNLKNVLLYYFTLNNRNQLVFQYDYEFRLKDQEYREKKISEDALMMNSNLGRLYYKYTWPKLIARVSVGANAISFKQNSVRKSFFGNRSNLILRYTPDKKNRIQYNLNFVNAVPDLKYQDTLSRRLDFFNIRRGNPDLNEIQGINQQLRYWFSRSNVDFMLYTRWDRYDGYMRNYVYKEGNNYIHSYISDGTFNKYSFYASSNFHFLKKNLNIEINGGLKSYHYGGKNPFSDTSIGWSLLADYSYEAWMFSFHVNGRSKDYLSDLKVVKKSCFYGASIMYSLNNFSITIGTNNPFSKSKTTREYNTGFYSSKNTTSSRLESYVAYLQLSWNFSFGRKHTYKEIDITKSVNADNGMNSEE